MIISQKHLIKSFSLVSHPIGIHKKNHSASVYMVYVSSVQSSSSCEYLVPNVVYTQILICAKKKKKITERKLSNLTLIDQKGG